MIHKGENELYRLSIIILILLIPLVILSLNSSSTLYSQNNGTFSIAKEGEPTKFYKLSWQQVEFAVSYIIQVSRDPMFRWEQDIFEFETEDTQIGLVLPFDTFYIRIAGKSKTDTVGDFSPSIRIIVETWVDEIYPKKAEKDEEKVFDKLYEEPFPETAILEKDDSIYIKIVNDPNEAIIEDYPDIVRDHRLPPVSKPLVFEYPDEICVNFYYYLAVCHYVNGNESLSQFYFELVYIISDNYIPEFEIDPERIIMKNGKQFEYTSPEYYKLHPVITKLIQEYFDNAEKMELKNENRKALTYYENILSIDPYNEKALNKIHYLQRILYE